MELNCDTCGEAFAGRKGARYCSGRCRTQAYRERHEGPKQPRRRRPLPEAFWTLNYDLSKKAEALERLTKDDRFSRNAPRLSGYRSDLVRTVETLQQVIDQLPEPEPLHRARL